MEDIYLSQSDESQELSLVIEGDDHSVYAYIVKGDEEEVEIIFDGFICSRGTIAKDTEEIKLYISQENAPPLLHHFVNEFSIQKNISNESFSIEWNDGIIKVHLDKVEFLIIDIENRKSYSKGISESGPYGFVLNEYQG